MSEVGEGWLRRRVRVHAAWDWRKEHPPMAEGVVVAYAPSPTITVRADDGSQSAWMASLPIDVLAEEQPIPDRRETCVSPKILLDEEARALYIALDDGPQIDHTDTQFDNVFVDVDENGKVVGVEVLW